MSQVFDTWTITIQPYQVTKNVKITSLSISYTQGGATKSTTISATGGSIQADPNTSITISVTYQNIGQATAYVQPWITVKKSDGSTHFDSGPAAAAIAVGQTLTSTLPSFTMINDTLTATIRLYNYELMYWSYPTPAEAEAGIDLNTILNFIITLILLITVMRTMGKVVERIA